MSPDIKALEQAILAYSALDEDPRVGAAVLAIHDRIYDLQKLVPLGGSLGAVYAAEIQGLRFALELLGEDES